MRRKRDLPRGIKYKFCAGSYIVFLNINKYLFVNIYKDLKDFIKKNNDFFNSFFFWLMAFLAFGIPKNITSII